MLFKFSPFPFPLSPFSFLLYTFSFPPFYFYNFTTSWLLFVAVNTCNAFQKFLKMLFKFSTLYFPLYTFNFQLSPFNFPLFTFNFQLFTFNFSLSPSLPFLTQQHQFPARLSCHRSVFISPSY